MSSASNIINTPGYANDVPGNITYDGSHSYTYDADGNLIAVDNGQTASYYYDSLNQRVRIVAGRGTFEFVFDAQGRRLSSWSGQSLVSSNIYTDAVRWRSGREGRRSTRRRTGWVRSGCESASMARWWQR